MPTCTTMNRVVQERYVVALEDKSPNKLPSLLIQQRSCYFHTKFWSFKLFISFLPFLACPLALLRRACSKAGSTKSQSLVSGAAHLGLLKPDLYSDMFFFEADV
ncbi:hypothetical protein EDC96DRAFT_542257 [Choanephora cucurbitarum]|nr:hypothetical protein EDC96DRAFT_542257 [Choanephora cucurbitarum]